MKPQEQQTLTEQVRVQMRAMGTFRAADVMNALGVRTYAEAGRVRGVIGEMRKSGEIRVESRGYYKYDGRKARRTSLDILWHLVRSHRQFETDAMERLSGAARATVLEYLQCLAKLGYIQKTGWKGWKLVRDPGPGTPTNTSKCQRLKRIRGRRGEALVEKDGNRNGD